MDGRVERLWYLPEGWKMASEPRPVVEYSENAALRQKTTGWSDVCDWNQIKKSPHVFLSRSPLTFGHSQLVVPSPGDCEQGLFRLASGIIYNVISTFRNAFEGDKPLHEDETFKSLAEYTLTRGLYKKTLVLRVSAQEDGKKEYKVHLVPYFESHELLCKKRFQSLHAVTDDQTGGLLGWLGEREGYLDKWEADPNPMKAQLDQIANEHLRMADLARELRNRWPSGA